MKHDPPVLCRAAQGVGQPVLSFVACGPFVRESVSVVVRHLFQCSCMKDEIDPTHRLDNGTFASHIAYVEFYLPIFVGIQELKIMPHIVLLLLIS